MAVRVGPITEQIITEQIASVSGSAPMSIPAPARHQHDDLDAAANRETQHPESPEHQHPAGSAGSARSAGPARSARSAGPAASAGSAGSAGSEREHGEHGEHEQHEHDLGLSHDLPTLLNRRRLLTLLGGAGAAAALAACGSGDETATTPSSSNGGPAGGGPGAATTAGTSTSDGEIPEETGGPFPADGSNGVNVLTESGIVRSDLTRSFGAASGVAAGVPLTIKLKVIDIGDGGKALAGSAVYLWHCNREGEYSMYSENVVSENYLRGVQEADADGFLTFTSIYPAAYSGRWPHIHFEVYPSLAEATRASSKLRTSQLALPEDASSAVYATAGYEASVQNLSQTSLESDNVFSDGYSLQLAKVTGSVSAGYTATLTVPV